MNQDIQHFWQEILTDISTPAALWQLAIIVAACGVALAINGALRAYVMRYAPENLKLAIGGVNRVLFPLSTLILVEISKIVLGHWQHTNLLQLAGKLLLALAVIRLAVYAVRYIVAPGGLLKALEGSISSLIWFLLALHLSGLSPELLKVLEDITFKIGKHPANLLLVLQAILTIVTTIFIALWVSRIIENKLMRAQHVNMNMRVVLNKVLRIFLLFVALLIALSAVGLDLTLLSVFGGAIGVGLGFGLQRIASNYVSGFIILLDQSMQIGDVITVDKHHGIVNDMRTRYMVLDKLDGTHVIIPNESLVTTAVVNHSLVEHKGRVQISLSVSHASNLELVMELMLAAARQQSRVLSTPAPEVQIKGFSLHGVDLVLNIWVLNSESGSSTLQSALYLAIWHVFEVNEIMLAKAAEAKLQEV